MQATMQSGTTADPILRAIFLAESINRRNSGAVIAPWEVDDLPDEWQAAYQALGTVARQTQQKNRMDGFFRSFRQKHPTYRKYH